MGDAVAEGSGRRSKITLLGLSMAIVAALVLAAAGPGYRLQLWGLGAGFDMLRWAVYIGLAGAAVSVAGARPCTSPGKMMHRGSTHDRMAAVSRRVSMPRLNATRGYLLLS